MNTNTCNLYLSDSDLKDVNSILPPEGKQISPAENNFHHVICSAIKNVSQIYPTMNIPELLNGFHDCPFRPEITG